MSEFKEKTCPICDKEFLLSPYHIYKKRVKGKDLIFCGWNCMVRWEKYHAVARKEGK